MSPRPPNRITVRVRDRDEGAPVPGMRVWWGDRQGHRILNPTTAQAVFYGLPAGALRVSAGPNVTLPWGSEVVAVPTSGQVEVEVLVDCKFTDVNTTAIPCRDADRLTEASRLVAASTTLEFSVDLIRDMLYQSPKQKLLYTMLTDHKYNRTTGGQGTRCLVTGEGDQTKSIHYIELHPFNQLGYKFSSAMSVKRKWPKPGSPGESELACGDECLRIARDVLQCPVLSEGALAWKTYHMDPAVTVATFKYQRQFLDEMPGLLAQQLTKGTSVRVPIIYGDAKSAANGAFAIGGAGNHFILIVGCSPDHRTFLYIDPLREFSSLPYPRSLADLALSLVKGTGFSNLFLGTFRFEAGSIDFKNSQYGYRIIGVPAAVYD